MPKSYALKNKQIRQDSLREELKAREYLRQIDEIAETARANWESMSAPQVGALRLALDCNLKRLDKCLPDLKSVEVKAEVEHVERVINATPLSEDEWEKEYCDNSADGDTKIS